MLPLEMELEVCWVYVLHVEHALVALAANPLLASLGGVLIARELFVDARRVGLLCLDLLGDWLTDTRVWIGWSLARAAGGRTRGLRVASPPL